MFSAPARETSPLNSGRGARTVPMRATAPASRRRCLALIVSILLSLSPTCAAEFNKLRGTHLRACVLLEKPYVIRDSTRRSGYSGLALDYLGRMQENLQFTIDYRKWNDTWSDFVAVMSTCDPDADCPCDIGLGSFTMTNARAESINFVWPFASEAHQMVTRRSAMRVDDSKNAWFVFRIFPAEVWASISAIVVLQALGTLVYTPRFDIFGTEHGGGGGGDDPAQQQPRVEVADNNANATDTNNIIISTTAATTKSNKYSTSPNNGSATTDSAESPSVTSFPSVPSSSSPASFDFHDHKPQPVPPPSRARRIAQKTLYLLYRFPYAVLFAYAHLLGEPLAQEPCDGDDGDSEKHHRPSVHRYAWVLLGITCGVFTLTVYEAGLTVLLFESEKTSPFDTLADITECRIDPERVAMIRGGASQEFWNSAVNTSENRAHCGWRTPGVTVQNLEEGFRALHDKRVDLFYSLEGSVRFRANGDCEKFEAAGAPFFSTAVAFVMPRRVNRTVLDELDRETRELIEQNEFPPASVIATRSECKPEIDPVVRFGKLSAFFSMYICVWFCLLLFRIAFLYHRWRRQRATRSDTLPELARNDAVAPPARRPVVADQANVTEPPAVVAEGMEAA